MTNSAHVSYTFTMLVLIDNYDSFTYNLVHFLGELGAACEVHRNDKITVDEVLRSKPKAIVLSPGPCTPNEAGICLELDGRSGPRRPADARRLPWPSGHCAGFTVARSSARLCRCTASSPLCATQGEGLFKGLPSRFKATRYHSLIVERASLPDCLHVTAETPDGIIMGLQHTAHPSTECSSTPRASPPSTDTPCLPTS